MLFGSAKCMRSTGAIMSHWGGWRNVIRSFLTYWTRLNSRAEDGTEEEKAVGVLVVVGGVANKMLCTARIIWKNNKATIMYGTHQLCVTVAAVKWRDAGFCFFSTEAFPLQRSAADIVYTINQASVTTVWCTLSLPKKSCKQVILMCLHTIMVNRLELALILDFEWSFEQVKTFTCLTVKH